MPIPDYQTLMLPLLRCLADGQARGKQELVTSLAAQFNFTPAEREALLPSGRQPIFYNRASWAATYLKKAGLLSAPHRGLLQITDRDQAILHEAPEHIDCQFLRRFPEFVTFRLPLRVGKHQEVMSLKTEVSEQALEEAIEIAYQQLRARLADEFIARILDCSPTFFEQVVLDLLVRMGYGGSRPEAAARLGRTSDGGIDGILKEDRLGLDVIFIQAKRWQGPVGRPEIQRFVGALQGQHAKKEIFITTSSFHARGPHLCGQDRDQDRSARRQTVCRADDRL
ncbi:winged helix-turn-helix domain-containing protein [Caldichromatium japonicum]|uniref:winged helix-turn-helix domain-containing protein n=1 Tax=Caldichromatium japonicum TaxID=2699430 RepID=UPI001FECAB95|nr:winged helix-turn-helix domain-containing protein [Caldichromatium japonicum]